MTTTMIKQLSILKCGLCGNIMEVLHVGDGGLVCCSQPMTLIVENSVDAAREKHVPVIEKTASGINIYVGSIAHPMEEKHYIEWIEVISEGKAYRQFLNPGESPEASFPIKSDIIVARAYCNLHGLWIGETND